MWAAPFTCGTSPVPQPHSSVGTGGGTHKDDDDEAEEEEEMGVVLGDAPLTPAPMVCDIRNRSSSCSDEKIGASLPAKPRRMNSSTSCRLGGRTVAEGWAGGQDEEAGGKARGEPSECAAEGKEGAVGACEVVSETAEEGEEKRPPPPPSAPTHSAANGARREGEEVWVISNVRHACVCSPQMESYGRKKKRIKKKYIRVELERIHICILVYIYGCISDV